MTKKMAIVFRKMKSNGLLIALFPELPADSDGLLCQSRTRLGEEGVDYGNVISKSRPALPEEYTDLLDEIKHLPTYRQIPLYVCVHTSNRIRESYLRTLDNANKNRMVEFAFRLMGLL